jgi:hypothetical protein
VTVLESLLRDAGIACRVEVRERLAILVPDDAGPTWEDRLRAIQFARAEGYTHVCVELCPHPLPSSLDPRGAALPGD